jgi:putative component of membrane protein insertase Oxa1/YidC/SpoIIIJ protein YidD
VKKYGPVVGAAKGAWRICRCNPWSRGGYDPP